MQTVSTLYRQIYDSGNFTAETKLTINGVDYGQDQLISMTTTAGTFSSASSVIGCCVAKEIDVVLLTPSETIPRAAEMRPYVRLVQGDSVSEWIPKGVFYIDTREKSETDVSTLKLHGYDKMLMAEQPFCRSSEKALWPKVDTDVIDEACDRLGVELDSRTAAILTNAYSIPFVGYGDSGMTIREVLGNIGAAYCGNFIFGDDGKLRLIPYGTAETSYLIDEDDEPITFGGDRIIV